MSYDDRVLLLSHCEEIGCVYAIAGCRPRILLSYCASIKTGKGGTKPKYKESRRLGQTEAVPVKCPNKYSSLVQRASLEVSTTVVLDGIQLHSH
jgi:hypothetical protein